MASQEKCPEKSFVPVEADSSGAPQHKAEQVLEDVASIRQKLESEISSWPVNLRATLLPAYWLLNDTQVRQLAQMQLTQGEPLVSVLQHMPSLRLHPRDEGDMAELYRQLARLERLENQVEEYKNNVFDKLIPILTEILFRKDPYTSHSSVSTQGTFTRNVFFKYKHEAPNLQHKDCCMVLQQYEKFSEWYEQSSTDVKSWTCAASIFPRAAIIDEHPINSLLKFEEDSPENGLLMSKGLQLLYDRLQWTLVANDFGVFEVYVVENYRHQPIEFIDATTKSETQFHPSLQLGQLHGLEVPIPDFVSHSALSIHARQTAVRNNVEIEKLVNSANYRLAGRPGSSPHKISDWLGTIVLPDLHASPETE